MNKSVFSYILLFVVLVFLQALLMNHIVLFNSAVCFVFIYFIIKLPMNTSSSKVIFFSFLIGFCVDVFSDTPGMNALACTCLGGCRHTVLRLYVPREDDVIHRIPGISSLGWAVFSKYVLTMSLLYCVMVNLIESFRFDHPLLLSERALGSTLLTAMLIMVTDFIFSRSQLSTAK